MKKLMIGVLAMMMVGLANADCNPATNVCVGPTGATLPLLALGAIALSVVDTLHPQACDNEPVRTVTEPGKGYSFTVAGCEYEANKAAYTVK